MSSNDAEATSTAAEDKKPIPAWKLRQQMLQKNAPPKPSQLNKQIAKKKTGFDAPLPPAFKTVRKQRLAFAKQQDRRANNDTWVSLNSSHPESSSHAKEGQEGTTEETAEYSSGEDNAGSDDDSFA
ncbi:unnamed protein product [Cylindrotheca closterium]|uniref:Uncharacterized protein n=1 Tax=Cylindrotheca closterium TaxID=2856 RepID=A0AAD2CEH5_9STRA|nr:unnamed protein product [Cylindrotheca closterium]